MALQQLSIPYVPPYKMDYCLKFYPEHFCLKPEVANALWQYGPLNNLQNLKIYEGSVFDMDTVYNGDQGVMALGNTGKHQVNFDKVESGEGSTTVFMF